jgi:hypothetical protein
LNDLNRLPTVISLDSVTAPCASFLAALQRLQNQKLLKYSPSDNLTPQMERDIDDMIANAAYNESQKTFQQMSQKESLTMGLLIRVRQPQNLQ